MSNHDGPPAKEKAAQAGNQGGTKSQRNGTKNRPEFDTAKAAPKASESLKFLRACDRLDDAADHAQFLAEALPRDGFSERGQEGYGSQLQRLADELLALVAVFNALREGGAE